MYKILTLFVLLSQFSYAQDVFDAARSGDAGTVLKLYQLNPDTINAVSDQGYSPLILACYYNQLEVIDLLMTYDVKLVEEKGKPSALQATCYKGFTAATGLLLEYGANPNMADANGTTPLIYAAQFNHVEIVQMLIDNRADRNYVDPRGLTAADYAEKLGFTDIVDILRK